MIDKKGLNIIEKLFEEKQEKTLNFKDIADRVRTDMNIMPLIRMSLFPQFNKD